MRNTQKSKSNSHFVNWQSNYLWMSCMDIVAPHSLGECHREILLIQSSKLAEHSSISALNIYTKIQTLKCYMVTLIVYLWWLRGNQLKKLFLWGSDWQWNAPIYIPTQLSWNLRRCTPLCFWWLRSDTLDLRLKRQGKLPQWTERD